jgi:hypothetical protein
MQLLLVGTLTAVVLFGGAGWGLAVVATRSKSRWTRLGILFGFLTVSLLPLLVHYSEVHQSAQQGIAYVTEHQEQYAPQSAGEIEMALSHFTWTAAGAILGLYVLSCVAGTVRLWGAMAFPAAAFLVYYFACYEPFTDEVYSFGEGDILARMPEDEAKLFIISLIVGLQVGLGIYVWKVGD